MISNALPAWDKPISLSSGREALERFQVWLADAFITADIDFLLQQRSLFIDHLLQTLWHQFGLEQEQLALIAVGGYGRGSLHPQSDIDLLIIHQGALSKTQQQAIQKFVQRLWDLRLDVGHSVRTIEQSIEQAAADVTVATSLLEHRLLSGDHALAEQFLYQVQQNFPWSSRDFYQAKLEEQQQRHLRYHGTAYNLEPNVKSNPGGLRDIQTISWIAKRHFQTQSDESLVQHGYMSAEELVELREHQQLLVGGDQHPGERGDARQGAGLGAHHSRTVRGARLR